MIYFFCNIFICCRPLHRCCTWGRGRERPGRLHRRDLGEGSAQPPAASHKSGGRLAAGAAVDAGSTGLRETAAETGRDRATRRGSDGATAETGRRARRRSDGQIHSAGGERRGRDGADGSAKLNFSGGHGRQ